jgi:hypothetical protein
VRIGVADQVRADVDAERLLELRVVVLHDLSFFSISSTSPATLARYRRGWHVGVTLPPKQQHWEGQLIAMNMARCCPINALPGALATRQAAQWTANGARGFDNWIPYTRGGLMPASSTHPCFSGAARTIGRCARSDEFS